MHVLAFAAEWHEDPPTRRHAKGRQMGHKQRVRHTLVEADLVVLPPGEPEILIHRLVPSPDCAGPI
jgi:hypothetical protein